MTEDKKIRTRVFKNYPVVADLFREWSLKKMSDQELADLTECPFCNASFDQSFSETDADGFTRVTCSGCDEYIEYNTARVDVEKSEIENLREIKADYYRILNKLFEMREMVRNNIDEAERNMEGAIHMETYTYDRGQKFAYLKCLRLLAAIGFEKKDEGGNG